MLGRNDTKTVDILIYHVYNHFIKQYVHTRWDVIAHYYWHTEVHSLGPHYVKSASVRPTIRNMVSYTAQLLVRSYGYFRTNVCRRHPYESESEAVFDVNDRLGSIVRTICILIDIIVRSTLLHWLNKFESCEIYIEYNNQHKG